ncbi:PucR family transcriptional regulator [Janibacter sp. G56]|uniref:PucR family transcriptional regulator n=1 Tax=Janibacter sp. G56 TaxID=3418717 RepID=UPI003D0589DD
MTDDHQRRTRPAAGRAPSGPALERVTLGLEPPVVEAMRARLPTVGALCVAAIIDEVPEYSRAMQGPIGAKIESAVQVALGTFLDLAARRPGGAPVGALAPALDAAHDLGRGEARSGRSMDALQAAYRVGARVSWRELSAQGLELGSPPARLADFAELVFAYIDELSAASVSGHAAESAGAEVQRRRERERLTRALLHGGTPEVLTAEADRIGWTGPQSLTAVLLPGPRLHTVAGLLDRRTLAATEDLPGLRADDDLGVLLVPDAGGAARPQLLSVLGGRRAIVGPALPWLDVHRSWERAVRTHRLMADPGDARGLRRPDDGAPVDTQDLLSDLVVAADPESLADLRARVLAPMADLGDGARDRLEETLRSWLLHLGRRDDVAADLHVHAQTVRYRMGQIRELYGERLNDPAWVRALVIALG